MSEEYCKQVGIYLYPFLLNEIVGIVEEYIRHNLEGKVIKIIKKDNCSAVFGYRSQFATYDKNLYTIGRGTRGIVFIDEEIEIKATFNWFEPKISDLFYPQCFTINGSLMYILDDGYIKIFKMPDFKFVDEFKFKSEDENSIHWLYIYKSYILACSQYKICAYTLDGSYVKDIIRYSFINDLILSNDKFYVIHGGTEYNFECFSFNGTIEFQKRIESSEGTLTLIDDFIYIVSYEKLLRFNLKGDLIKTLPIETLSHYDTFVAFNGNYYIFHKTNKSISQII